MPTKDSQLRRALLQHNKHISGDDDLLTTEGLLETAVNVLDRIKEDALENVIVTDVAGMTPTDKFIKAFAESLTLDEFSRIAVHFALKETVTFMRETHSDVIRDIEEFSGHFEWFVQEALPDSIFPHVSKADTVDNIGGLVLDTEDPNGLIAQYYNEHSQG